MPEEFRIVIDVIRQAAMITSFVMVMMLIIEYVNVQTKGSWAKSLQQSGWLQIIVSSILGIIPGCLGTFTVVSLYTHRLIGFSALVAATIATFGDEAFIIFSVIPQTAFKLMTSIFIIAIISGFVIRYFEKKLSAVRTPNNILHPHQSEDKCMCFNAKKVIPQLKNISFPRAIILIGLILYIFNLIFGTFDHVHIHNHNHNHSSDWDWVKITFLISSLIAFIIVSIVSDHFLEKHLWGHIIKVHLFKIFFWVVGAILFIEVIENYIDISAWVKTNHLTILLIAVLVGIIPESGPHIVFITLFAQGTIPFGILLANSIVQDGHGTLPLFAESKISFLMVKLVNLIIGFSIGLITLYIKF